MLKQLRLKFVLVNMVIVTVLLSVILGLVYSFTSASLAKESLNTLENIASSPQPPDAPGAPERGVRLPYFTIHLLSQGGMVASGAGFYNLSDEELMHELAQAVLDAGTRSGVLSDYGLRFYRTGTPQGQLLLFADMSSERSTLRGLLRTCLLIGVLGFGVFLGVSLLLARWAVRPVDQAWKQQQQFVNDASHELKTPLTVIITNAELLQSPGYDEASRTQFSASILTMAQQMRGLVESLLELARVDNGQVKTTFARVDFSRLLDNALLPFEPIFFEKQLELASQVEPDILLTGSEVYLRQVAEILLDNAQKYGVAPGSVCVQLRRQGRSHCLFSVASPGPAIPPEERENLFKRFYRLDKARSRTGSYGLGLSIAQRIVLEHHGRIWVESAGGVNTFSVLLPLDN